VAHSVTFSPEARADLLELYDYIADHSGAARALNYVERAEQRCLRLATFPERGTSRDDVRPGLRTIGFERRVLIAFQAGPDTVVILRILYGGRDLVRHLG
jgi:toxin ParE1/3/4